MKAFTNTVIVKVDYNQTEKKTKSGIYLCTDSGYNPGKNNERHGIVISVCDKLYFDSKGKDYNTSVYFDVPIEVNVGDKVYFPTDVSNNCHKIIENGYKLYFIKYDELICKEVDGELYPLSGRILAKNVYDKTNSTLTINDSKLSNKKVEVLKVGCNVNRYFGSKPEHEPLDINIGDILYVLREFSTRTYVEESLYSSDITKGVLYLHPKDVMAKELK
jgi:co-chaperonin GroES (HSP10)